MQSDDQSPYRVPESDVTMAAGGGDDLMSAFLGPKNVGFYKRAFAKIESGGGNVGWHWPACLVTWFWLAYRKMWAWFFGYWLLWPIIVGVVAGLAGLVHESLVYVVYIAGLWVVPPLFANALYHRHALGKIAKAQQVGGDPSAQALEAARLGGTSNVVVILIPAIIILAGILAAIAIPAYQDYTIRAQVSEGLNLASGAKAAVTEYYQDTQSAPASNAQAGLAAPAEISGMYTSSVAVYDGEVVITYGNNAHQVISGNELNLVPQVANGRLEWQCYSETIAAKHLPAACR
jgi:Tfp pilus assembly major pilin PilA